MVFKFMEGSGFRSRHWGNLDLGRDYMSNWKETAEESRKRWEQNADYWDERMGEDSNRFHRQLVRPDTERLLAVQPGDKVLDIACGNGNFSKRLAELGAKVTAFDYSSKMIEHARKRCRDFLGCIDFRIIDATDYNQIMSLKENGPFTKAVSNMAVMDIADINPLLQAVYGLLQPGGAFVFSTSHPCFMTPGMRKLVESEDIDREIVTRSGLQLFEYITPRDYQGIALVNQPVTQFYYHRPLSLLLNLCFEAGFALDGFAEPVFARGEDSSKFDWYEFPPVIIVRLRK